MSTWPCSSIFKEWLLDFFGDGYIDGNLSLAHPLQRPRDVDGPGVPGFRDRPAMSEPSFSKVGTRVWEKCRKTEFWKRYPPENQDGNKTSPCLLYWEIEIHLLNDFVSFVM